MDSFRNSLLLVFKSDTELASQLTRRNVKREIIMQRGRFSFSASVPFNCQRDDAKILSKSTPIEKIEIFHQQSRLTHSHARTHLLLPFAGSHWCVCLSFVGNQIMKLALNSRLKNCTFSIRFPLQKVTALAHARTHSFCSRVRLLLCCSRMSR